MGSAAALLVAPLHHGGCTKKLLEAAHVFIVYSCVVIPSVNEQDDQVKSRALLDVRLDVSEERFHLRRIEQVPIVIKLDEPQLEGVRDTLVFLADRE